MQPVRNEKGQYVKGTPSPNPAGAPRRGSSWSETVRKMSDMTRDELIAMVGASTEVGRHLKEMPPGITMKEAMVLISFIAFGRDPDAAMFKALADREEGKPRQTVQVDGMMDISKTQGLLDKAYGDDA